MHTPHGFDRLRVIGAKVILQSRLSKGWTPRTPKSLTHSEFPGTAVYWDEEYFEVVAADAVPSGGVRYVLEPWRDDHTIRTFESYDAASEERLAADHKLAEKQRRNSILTRLSGMVLGHLPSPVQNRLGNELGVFPARMTMISCIPPVVVLGICVFVGVGARLDPGQAGQVSIPGWLTILAAFLTIESIVRFYVAMSQNRGMGSLLGTLIYMFIYVLSGSRKKSMPEPLQEAGDGVFFMIPPSEEVARRDSIAVWGAMLTLLTPAEQARLASKYEYNYREKAFGIAWIILTASILGVVSSWIAVQEGRVSGLVSLLVAAALAVEQILRLSALRRGPAGSMLAFVVRPFVKDLLK